jgi:hypothetical protein
MARPCAFLIPVAIELGIAPIQVSMALECVRKSVKRFSDKTHDKTKS